MRPGHPLSRGRLNALVSVSGGLFQGSVDAQLAVSGLTRNIIVSVPSFLAGIDPVRRSKLPVSVPYRLSASRTKPFKQKVGLNSD